MFYESDEVNLSIGVAMVFYDREMTKDINVDVAPPIQFFYVRIA